MDKQKPVATIEMENGGLIKVELDPVNAPNTVRNFIALAEGDSTTVLSSTGLFLVS